MVVCDMPRQSQELLGLVCSILPDMEKWLFLAFQKSYTVLAHCCGRSPLQQCCAKQSSGKTRVSFHGCSEICREQKQKHPLANVPQNRCSKKFAQFREKTCAGVSVPVGSCVLLWTPFSYKGETREQQIHWLIFFNAQK